MRVSEIFSEVYNEVLSDDINEGLIGTDHDIHHALRVAERARQIAYDEWRDERLADLAGLAGLCHNADRFLQAKLKIGHRDVAPEQVRELLEKRLGKAALKPAEREKVILADLNHGLPNSQDDSPVQIALMDGDRLVNLDADVIIRSAQFYAPEGLPAIDFNHYLDDPEATFREPKSVVRDLKFNLEWVQEGTPVCVRTRLGKELGLERKFFFDMFFRVLKKQLLEEKMNSDQSSYANHHKSLCL